MHLKLRQLEVFYAVMEEGSISRAAERLHLTQPAVSIALSSLENQLGFQLFDRSPGHFTPRVEAEMLIADAELSILATEQFVNRAKSIAQGDTGLIRLGTIGCPANSLLPELIANYSQRFPRVNIDMQVRSSAQLLHLVSNGQLDISIIEGQATSNKVSTTPVTLPCVCIMADTDPLAREAQITPELLQGRQLIGIQDDNQIDQQLRACFTQHDLDYHTRIKGFFFSVVRRMVALGSGVAVVDAMNGTQSLEDGVIWRPFVPSITYQLSVIQRRDEALHQPVADFRQELLERLECMTNPHKHFESPFSNF